ncbi:LRR receptor-like serine/threonine-protein kinase GSO1 [Chenopodium quinoa]|uniref:LRR receptor-like serine/threonine-protein kinase GSO1 n=1 Tax=Chenopodium quinoa TaxID=63459 RepID=UPI000B78A787|nr:LRR receptor-like serine/threonine-protein kinase GSO1 [Chenopodium quinoa]
MSNNNITGKLPNLSHPIFDHWRPLEVDLSFNSFEGTIPSFLGNVSSLKLNNNKFSNPIPLLCPKSKIVLLDLDLSNNLSSGELPDDCWENMDELSYLNLESNQFSGKLPQSIGAIKQLQSFRLCDNTFSGVLPISLWNCSSLVILDIGDNQFSGIIPPEIGNLRSLVDLNLRKNRLVGKIPSTLFTLSSLQILDLSGNRLTGTIPKSIYNLTGMSNKTIFLPNSTIISSHKSFTKYPHYAAWVKWKRVQQKFGNLLGLVKSFDVSNNNLQGEIPSEISYLGGLVSLDLSRNKFSGTITSNIGQLTSLEFLDLSNNRFCGEIPMSFVNLSYLGILDLSNNNLSGRIPLGTQLRGFDASYYMGNPGLCGEPLPKTCPGDEAFNKSRDGEDIELTRQDKDDEEGVFSLGLYISVVLGFIFGFWGVYGTLVLKTSWRQAYFRCVDSIKDRFYVIIAVNLARVSKA